MLRILGSARKFCEGLTRRDLLRVGGLGVAGLSLPELLALQDSAAAASLPRPAGFGKAKGVILIHLYGAPSQLEWVDPKPDAPADVRGELTQIRSALPGCDVGELFPNFGKVLDRCTVLRSLTHPYPIHGVAFALTGVPSIDVAMELSPRDPRHWPFFGSVVEYVESKARSAFPRVPPNIALPFRFSSRRVGEVPRAGPYAAFLGSQFDPVYTDFVGTATKGITKTLRDLVYTDNDPYIGCSPDSHFVVPSASGLLAEVTIDRLQNRRTLLEQFNVAKPALERSIAGRTLTKQQQAAIAVLESDRLAKALDLRSESASVRDAYGHTLFGQSCLAARRLIEAGSRVVTVFWDEFGLAGMGWDTHWNHYPRMRQELCPGLDQGWYGLINDLDQRGMLDDTLVVCTSEHGRTPKLNSSPGAGRDHWSQVYSSVLAGGGIARGRVVGASDRIAGEVADLPLSPKDLLATMYFLLGIDHHQPITDRSGRSFPLVEGRVISEALA
ncbi:MAG: DUF1501 domain-containing protein [Planctomycetes bacterium]|nr:DUF1501 domain-containing protein [Planctomycetota bacterium]